MAKTAAPSAKKLRQQCTDAWPKRNQASDGIVPSAAHTKESPNSDHEPGKAGYCHAVDITHDPNNGCDAGKVLAAIVASRESRFKYGIYNKQITYGAGSTPSGKSPWIYYSYTGTNPHTKHAHVSIVDTKAACESTANWSIAAGTPPKTTGRLDENGILDSATVIRWQEIMGTLVDGIISGQSTVNKKRHQASTAIRYGSGGSSLVRAVQKKLGKNVDGQLEVNTINAIQKHLGAQVDGYFSAKPSEMVRALQKRLNTGKF